MIIPSYTIRFSRTGQHRPLGIGYSEFETNEIALKVISDLNGTIFFNRNLTMKIHTPCVPRVPFTSSLARKFSYRRDENKENQDPQEKTNAGTKGKAAASDVKGDGGAAIVIAQSASSDVTVEAQTTKVVKKDEPGVTKSAPINPNSPPYLTPLEHHDDKIRKLVIRKVNKKITTWDVEQLLDQLKPSTINIIQQKKFRFNSNYVNVVIIFEDEEKSTAELIKSIGNIKFNGHELTVEPYVTPYPKITPSVSINKENDKIDESTPQEYDEHPFSGKRLKILKRPDTKGLEAEMSNVFIDSSIIDESDTFDDSENLELRPKTK